MLADSTGPLELHDAPDEQKDRHHPLPAPRPSSSAPLPDPTPLMRREHRRLTGAAQDRRATGEVLDQA